MQGEKQHRPLNINLQSVSQRIPGVCPAKSGEKHWLFRIFLYKVPSIFIYFFIYTYTFYGVYTNLGFHLTLPEPFGSNGLVQVTINQP